MKNMNIYQSQLQTIASFAENVRICRFFSKRIDSWEEVLLDPEKRKSKMSDAEFLKVGPLHKLGGLMMNEWQLRNFKLSKNSLRWFKPSGEQEVFLADMPRKFLRLERSIS